jgi:magnesium-transporting ATPase (P-type)
MALAKIALGIGTLSLFFCVNGLFNIGILVAIAISLRGYHRETREKLAKLKNSAARSLSCYRHNALVIIFASLTCAFYYLSVLLNGGSFAVFDMYVGISIAAITFIELGITVGGIISARHDKEPIIESIRFTNLATALLALVLTQIALMSFSYEGDASYYCAATGVVFSCLCAGIGVFMQVRARRFNDSQTFLKQFTNTPPAN